MSTDTNTIDRIKSLRREAAAIGGFHSLYSAKFAADSRCDKKGYGFNSDNRFAAFTVNATFASYAGYYGNSGCHNILSVNNKVVVEKAFARALNIHQEELFATAARLMREEAASLADKAREELAALEAMLDSALADVAEAQSATAMPTKTPPEQEHTL